jgi:HPr Serine kinase C-terminal domain
VQSRVYGLTLDAELPLPGLPSLFVDSAGPRWRVCVGSPTVPTGRSVLAADDADNADGADVRLDDDDAFSIAFCDGVRFSVSRSSATITMSWPASLAFEDALVYLVGPALGAAVRLERRSVLHASAVHIRECAVLLLGDAGAGKSTLTAALLDRGHKLVTEDVSAIAFDDAGAPGVFRGGSRVKLWDDSVVGLRGKVDALAALVPTNPDWTKKFLDASRQMTNRDVTPIASIVLLRRDDGCATPRLEDLSPHDRLLMLIANGYASRLVLPDDRANELARLSALARAVPVRRLVYPNDMKRLPEVVEFLARSC